MKRLLFVLLLLAPGGARADTLETSGPSYQEDLPAAPPAAYRGARWNGDDGEDGGDYPPEQDPDQDQDQGGFDRGGGRGGFPAFNAAWGMSRSVYEKAARSFDGRGRYAVVIDMGKHSSKKRFFLFDLSSGRVESYHVAHGSGSDPGNTGYATRFSDVAESKMTSLGVYRTAGTYYGKHGLQLRLEGLEGSNRHALERGIVVHGANYVSEAGAHAGRSWGCPALDPAYSTGIINRIAGGSMLVIWR